MSGHLRVSPFVDAEIESGASFAEILGWQWATGYGDVIAEHVAVREGAAVWDGSPHQKFEFAGDDAARVLDDIFTRRISDMEIGVVRYGPYCNEQGRMIGDATVFRLARDKFWMITAPSTDGDIEHFNELSRGSAVVTDITSSLPQLGLNGPLSREILQALCDVDLRQLRYFRFLPEMARVAGIRCWISRTGYSGELGYELFCSPDDCTALWRALVQAGAQPYGLNAVELVRIESGLIAFGAEFLPHKTSPYDCSLDRFIDFSKEHFCGRDALQIEAAAPRKCLATIVFDGDQLPQGGATVWCGGSDVGRLTSPCRSPVLGANLGLAVIGRDIAQDGRYVSVGSGNEAAQGIVVPTPAYDTDKHRRSES